jgi:hypothetical protein
VPQRCYNHNLYTSCIVGDLNPELYLEPTPFTIAKPEAATHLHPAVHVLFIHFQDAIHPAKVHTHTSLQGCNMALYGGSSTKGHNGSTCSMAQPDYGHYFFCGFGIGNYLGRYSRVVGFICTVLL